MLAELMCKRWRIVVPVTQLCYFKQCDTLLRRQHCLHMEPRRTSNQGSAVVCIE